MAYLEIKQEIKIVDTFRHPKKAIKISHHHADYIALSLYSDGLLTWNLVVMNTCNKDDSDKTAPHKMLYCCCTEIQAANLSKRQEIVKNRISFGHTCGIK